MEENAILVSICIQYMYVIEIYTYIYIYIYIYILAIFLRVSLCPSQGELTLCKCSESRSFCARAKGPELEQGSAAWGIFAERPQHCGEVKPNAACSLGKHAFPPHVPCTRVTENSPGTRPPLCAPPPKTTTPRALHLIPLR